MRPALLVIGLACALAAFGACSGGGSSTPASPADQQLPDAIRVDADATSAGVDATAAHAIATPFDAALVGATFGVGPAGVDVTWDPAVLEALGSSAGADGCRFDERDGGRFLSCGAAAETDVVELARVRFVCVAAGRGAVHLSRPSSDATKSTPAAARLIDAIVACE